MPVPATVYPGATVRYRVPECLDCAALPTLDEALAAPGGDFTLVQGVDYRPAKPRPIASGCGPRSLRCATHKRAHERALRQRASDKRSRERAGVDEPTRQEVLAEQGGVCAGCGHGHGGKRYNLDADHDHDLAAEHEHDDDVACLDCLRGFLDRSCNRDIIGVLRGRFRSDEAVARVLRNLADYLTDPPAARVRARRAQTQRSA